MCSSGINGEGELRRQPANPGSPGKMAVKTVCVCVCVCVCVVSMPYENSYGQFRVKISVDIDCKI